MPIPKEFKTYQDQIALLQSKDLDFWAFQETGEILKL